MKRIRFGNLLEANRGIIVHGCNAQGVMGAGVALALKRKYPKIFPSYCNFLEEHKKNGTSPLGEVDIVRVGSDLYVANAITQLNFGRDKTRRYCSYEAIHKSFKCIADIAGTSIEKLPVHHSLIGAGLANGEWSIISEIIDCAFESYPEVERTLWLNE